MKLNNLSVIDERTNLEFGVLVVELRIQNLHCRYTQFSLHWFGTGAQIQIRAWQKRFSLNNWYAPFSFFFSFFLLLTLGSGPNTSIGVTWPVCNWISFGEYNSIHSNFQVFCTNLVGLVNFQDHPFIIMFNSIFMSNHLNKHKKEVWSEVHFTSYS